MRVAAKRGWVIAAAVAVMNETIEIEIKPSQAAGRGVVMAFSRRVRFALPWIFGGVLLGQLPNVISRSGKVIRPLHLAKGAVERGCVVLDQPQRLGANRDAKLFCLLRLIVDTAALRVA